MRGCEVGARQPARTTPPVGRRALAMAGRARARGWRENLARRRDELVSDLNPIWFHNA